MTANHEVILPPMNRRPALPDRPPNWADPRRLNASVRAPARAGRRLIMAFFLVFGGWGFLVPLAGGAVAPGIITPDSYKKTVQHLEGGIIADLRVREGAEVTAGQPLLVLESVQENATYDTLREQHWMLLAKQARLDAERAEGEQIEWPGELQSEDPRVRAVVGAQQRVFETRRDSRVAKRKVLQQKIEQLSEQINGINAELQSASSQISLIEEEMQAKDTLVAKNLIAKPEALRVRRMHAEMVGKRGEYIADIARVRQQIGETRMQLLADDAERADQVANEADKVHNDQMSVLEKMRSSADVLRRMVVTAPISGTIVNLRFKTVGGVVQRGESILEIVPSDDALVIDARVTPLDVKAVHKGLQAQIQLSAYTSRDTPRIPGVVQSVSADRIVDAATHQPYYLARVTVNRDLLRRMAPHVELIPGMPADVLIVTGHRTMIDYLSKPFRDAFWRSFRES
jgi:HlyD family secretion protein/epimerase transport system membrane fusion protein